MKETRGRGWWLPAGLVDPWETFTEAAHRETLEVRVGYTRDLQDSVAPFAVIIGAAHTLHLTYFAQMTAKQEAGIPISLEGVFRVEHSVLGADVARMRVIFYARPSGDVQPKAFADEVAGAQKLQ